MHAPRFLCQRALGRWLEGGANEIDRGRIAVSCSTRMKEKVGFLNGGRGE
jgi:hypothetical protein